MEEGLVEMEGGEVAGQGKAHGCVCYCHSLAVGGKEEEEK